MFLFPELEVPFRQNLMKSRATSTPLLLTYIDVTTVRIFPHSESRLVNSNFGRANGMQGDGGPVIYFAVFLDTYLLDVEKEK